ncbi:MAG: AMP-binding protein, partial [Calditrichaeota bacterium]|nr:AMP-binding protein [Calditrichota bacterium]
MARILTKSAKTATTLSPEKRKQLEAKLKSKATMLNASPMSFSQQRLWVLYQLDPSSAAYNIPGTMHLKGKVDIKAFEKSLQEIAKRHEILRTRFASLRGSPVQLVSAKVVMDFKYIDLRTVDALDRESRAGEMIKQDAACPFDLTRLPLFRTRLYQLDDDQFSLLVNMHHIISDGWSITIFVRELMLIYEAFHAGRAPQLPKLPIQFGDYARWQKNWLKGDVLARQVSYWKKQLDQLPAILELPTDYPRPAIKGAKGSLCYAELPQNILDNMKQLAKTEGVTQFILFLAVIQVLLYYLSNQKDVAVGVPIANRTHAEIEPLIGFFVNTLVMRSIVDAQQSFCEFLQGVKETAYGAYAHQDLPFEMLVEQLNPERNMSVTPLFQVLFTFQDDVSQTIQLENLTLEPFETEAKSSKVDLAFNVIAAKNSFVLSIVYDTEIYKRSTIERFLHHFEVLLNHISKNPQCPISDISIMSEDEENDLVAQWNNTATHYPKDQCVHQLFEQTAIKFPEKIVVRFNELTLTYQQLNQQANQLANFLRMQGIGPESVVGLFMERSIGMIIAILGIIKAGGLYLPLDPNYPEKRLSFMFNDSRAN